MPQVSIPDTTQLIDKETLNESERAFVEMFERERGGSQSSQSDDTTLTSAEDLADTTGTPGSSTTPPAAPDAPSTVEGPSGASVSEPSGTTEVQPLDASGNVITGATEPATELSTSTTPVEGEPPSSEPAQSAPAFTFAGVDYSSSDLAQAVQLRDWYTRLNNPQIQAIDALLSGEYQLVPTSQSQVAPVAIPPAPQPATSPASPPDTPVNDDAGEWLDPRAEAEINRLRTELTQLTERVTSSVTPLIESRQTDQFNATLSAIDQAHTAFQTEYTLDDDTMQQLGQAVVNAGVFPSLLQQHRDPQVATKAAFDMMLWTTPTFRDKIVTQRLTALATDSQAQAQADKTRKLTSLASSGGSVPRRTTTPQTKEERHQAMVEEIRASQNGNGSI